MFVKALSWLLEKWTMPFTYVARDIVVSLTGVNMPLSSLFCHVSILYITLLGLDSA